MAVQEWQAQFRFLVDYGGGGGGACYNTGTDGSGGNGGGGNAGVGGVNGIANTGGGGGGSRLNSTGGSGGSGVVILSVPTGSWLTATYTGSMATTSGGRDIYTLTTSGTLTVVSTTSSFNAYWLRRRQPILGVL